MPDSQSNPGRVLSFTEHLEELRVRLIICVTWAALCFAASLFFAPYILEWLIAPLTTLEAPVTDREMVLRLRTDGTVVYAGTAGEGQETVAEPLTTTTLSGISRDRLRLELPFNLPPVRAGGGHTMSKLVYLSPIEPVMLFIKGALLSTAVFAIPMAVYQFWLFLAPGLLRRERKAVKWTLGSAMFLFPAGALFAYFISSICLKFLMAVGAQIPGLVPNITAGKYIGFILGMMLASGVMFEAPVVLVLLSRLGIIDSEFLAKRRKLAVVILSITAAIATPSPDPFSMILAMMPLLALYEISIWAIRALERAAAADKAMFAGQKSVDA